MHKPFIVFLSIFLISISISCSGQKKIIIQRDSDFIGKQSEIPVFDEIIATQNGMGRAFLPQWLIMYLEGGILEIESSEIFRDKYIFIGRNWGTNLSIITRWAENYNVYHDFPRLAAARIENRLITAANLYPDDEYGDYFEALVKKAFNTEYTGALKDETFWIKTRTHQEADPDEPDQIVEPLELYEYFILISIDKKLLQTQIQKLMAEINIINIPTRNQRAAVSRVEQIFFVGF